nr:integrase, catalytic region, zinc finger, CCHC-type, peptidase aspartic, catalytic [Tanacetum cinerariifolium]
MDHVKPKVLARGKYAIDVEPILPRLWNNRDAHLDYLRHLKESVETIHDIVEEAKVVRPLDRSIVSACRYTKHSQELLEYAIGTCPQDSLQQNKQLAHIPLIRKKQVTFANLSNTSNSNTHKPVAKVHTQKTNVPVPPSTGVKHCTNASGSQPRSNTKKNRISPAKGVNKLPVEEQSRTNKSLLRTSNRVDSSSRIKRTVINSNSDSICQTCCSKHMTGDRSRLMNFMKKFIGTVRFGNDHFGAIMGMKIIHDEVLSNLFVVQSLQEQIMFIASAFKPLELWTGPAPNLLTPGQISSRLVPNSVPATPYLPPPPTNKDLEILFQPMFDEYLEPPRVERPVSPAQAVQAPVNSAGTPSSTTIDQDAPSPSILPSSSALQSHQGIAAKPTYMEDHPVSPVYNNPFVNLFALEPHSEASSSGDISSTVASYVSQTLHHLNK